MKPRLPAVRYSPVAACPAGFCFVRAGCGQGAGASGPCRCALGARLQAFGVAAGWVGVRGSHQQGTVCDLAQKTQGLACLCGIKGKRARSSRWVYIRSSRPYKLQNQAIVLAGIILLDTRSLLQSPIPKYGGRKKKMK